MNRLARFNADVAPLFPPLLTPLGLWIAGIGTDTLNTGGFLGVAVGWLVLVALTPVWRQRIRAVAGGRRPGLSVALWLFAGLTLMLLAYKMLWGLEHAGDLLAKSGDVFSRAFQAVAFYVAAVYVSLLPVSREEAADAVAAEE